MSNAKDALYTKAILLSVFCEVDIPMVIHFIVKLAVHIS
jgi:hypothetical protein